MGGSCCQIQLRDVGQLATCLFFIQSSFPTLDPCPPRLHFKNPSMIGAQHSLWSFDHTFVLPRFSLPSCRLTYYVGSKPSAVIFVFFNRSCFRHTAEQPIHDRRVQLQNTSRKTLWSMRKRRLQPQCFAISMQFDVETFVLCIFGAAEWSRKFNQHTCQQNHVFRPKFQRLPKLSCNPCVANLPKADPALELVSETMEELPRSQSHGGFTAVCRWTTIFVAT